MTASEPNPAVYTPLLFGSTLGYAGRQRFGDGGSSLELCGLRGLPRAAPPRALNGHDEAAPTSARRRHDPGSGQARQAAAPT